MLNKSLPFPVNPPNSSPDKEPDMPEDDVKRRIVAIFYHLYIPDNTTGRVNKALDILHEQIHQLGRSYLTNQTDFPVVLYYNTVGNLLPDLHSVIDNLCQEAGVASCQHLNHFRSAFEEVTHASMQTYCQRQSPTDYDAPLLYFHSKGAFQDHRGKQKQWRRNMLAAITGLQCTAAMTQSTRHSLHTCNVCGLQFLPIWQMIMAGNFFFTKCSHVQKLLDPVVYKQEMGRVTKPLGSLGFSMRAFAPACDALGASRWSPELWISSHPGVVPCDLGHESADFLFYQVEAKLEGLAEKGKLKLDFAPRHSFRAGWRRLQRRHLDPWSDYSLLPGVLYRHLELYQQLPPNSSWIWEWFPGGSLWRDYMSEAISAVDTNANFSVLSKTEVGLAIDAVLHALRNKTRVKSRNEMEEEARKFDNFDFTKC
eukprot:scaffold3342_cov174-Amphora_coffeaeformis.AAC.3